MKATRRAIAIGGRGDTTTTIGHTASTDSNDNSHPHAHAHAIRRLSTGNDDEEEEEEEMVSLGLSVNGLLIPTVSSDVGDSENHHHNHNSTTSADVVVPNNNPPNNMAASAAMATATSSTPGSMVGTNRKSAFPATPATPGAPVVRLQQQQQQQTYRTINNSNNNNNNNGAAAVPMRRTPGPMQSVAHSARHRRTPGAGQSGSTNEADFTRSQHARTPVMSGAGNSRLGKTPHKQYPPTTSSLVTPSNKTQNNPGMMTTPNMATTFSSQQQYQQHQGRQLYTPAQLTLAKNADLHMENVRPDAFSPATIRMTDSLEKILTDDDDYLEARQRATTQMHQAQQGGQLQVVQGTQQMLDQSSNTSILESSFDSYSKTRVDPVTQSATHRGAFRRIQSTADSDDEVMPEMQGIEANSSGERTGDLSSPEDDEDEAEISQINVDEDEDEEGSIKAVDSSMTRPKPMNLSSGGGAFKPKPQRTMPPGYHGAQGEYGQGGGGAYYPSQQQHNQHQQHGYFGGDMLFNHEQQQQLHHHGPPHHPYPHQTPYGDPYGGAASQHSPQNFHLPSGMVSPLNLPPDYSQGYNAHHQMGGDWSLWRGGGSVHPPPDAAFGFDHGSHHSQQGMMSTMPGHASPVDYRFHEMSGAISPFNMSHHQQPYQHPQQYNDNHNTYRGHYPQQQSYHGMAHPGMHPPPSGRQRTNSKDRRNRNRSYTASPSPLKQQQSFPLSPIKQQQPQGSPQSASGVQRPRLDSFASSTGSVFSVSAEPFSPKSSSTASVIRQVLPETLRPTASSDEQDQHGINWFSSPQGSNNASFAAIDSSGSSPYLKQQRRVNETYGNQQQQEQLPRRGKKGVGQRNQVMPVQKPQPGDARRRKTAGKQQSQHPRDQRSNKYQQGGPHQGGHIHHNNNAVDEEKFVIESPTERQAYKEFGRVFRQKENESLESAREYALACLKDDDFPVSRSKVGGVDVHPLPPSTHWRVHLELADIAKRSNNITLARNHYRQACTLQPRASQGWLEHSKLEEESGNLPKCAAILREGLDHCSTNENLLVRAIKFYERMNDLDAARKLLSRTKHLNIDKSWKIMLEGALLEARAGRYSMAREVLKYLTHYVPWYGPLYLAHTKLERDYGSPTEAFSIVQKGLKELPRYGPLYFQAFRLLEREDLSHKAYDLPRTMDMVSRADSISRELLWKVHLEAAQMQERAAILAIEQMDFPNNKQKQQMMDLHLPSALQATRRSYAKAIMLCPTNLSWKIWLASGRTEVSCDNTRVARDLFLRAHDSVSEKGRSTVLLECARLEEYVGDLTLARALLCKARNLFGKSDWKVWLSSVNLECRCGQRERAIAFAREALDIHRGTGRLWAALIQLRHNDGELYQMKVLKCALQSVPKSGEVWCEGARIYLNPFSPTFDMRAASRHLSFAARFTPQYGDSFLEQLRLDMIDQWLIPLATPFINSMYDAFVSHDERMQTEDIQCFVAKHTKNAADVMKTQLKESDLFDKDVLDTSELELRCSSADPNYGHLWFRCRSSPIDTARDVIAQAKIVMTESMIDYSYLYIAAMVRRSGVLMLLHHQDNKIVESGSSSRHRDAEVEKQLRSIPSLEMMISVDVSAPMFTSGCGGKDDDWSNLSLSEKRRILFGSDSLT